MPFQSWWSLPGHGSLKTLLSWSQAEHAHHNGVILCLDTCWYSDEKGWPHACWSQGARMLRMLYGGRFKGWYHQLCVYSNNPMQTMMQQGNWKQHKQAIDQSTCCKLGKAAATRCHKSKTATWDSGWTHLAQRRRLYVVESYSELLTGEAYTLK